MIKIVVPKGVVEQMGYLVLYLGITVVGYGIGTYIKKKEMGLKGVGAIQAAAIMLLVFFMGSRIGADRSIVRSLDTIGLTAFVITLFVLAGSVAAVFVTRRLLGFDRRGNIGESGQNADAEAGLSRHGEGSSQDGWNSSQEKEVLPQNEERDDQDEAPEEKGKTDHRMTICIIVSVAAGILAGYFLLPRWFTDLAGTLIVIGLCILLIFVGMDIGVEGTIVQNFKRAGWRILVFPFIIMIGTYAGALLSSLILPINVIEALCVGSGFGWYTLAPAMLADVSARLSAMSFMHNVMREVTGIILIPVVANRIGYIETVSLPGAAAMDVCLPIVERATSGNIVIYSFLSGVVLSIAVPVMVGFMMGFA